MVLHKVFPQLLILISIITIPPKLVFSTNQPLPTDCQRKCGDVNIPYPFGTTLNCSRGLPFLVSCEVDSLNTKPFLYGSSVQITNISLIDGQLDTIMEIAMKCYGVDNQTDAYLQLGDFFTVSETQNKFTVVGCNSYGYIRGTSVGDSRSYRSGCISLCDDKSSVMNGTCSGNGCCQISITKGLNFYNMSAYNFDNKNNIDVYNYSPCSYSFITDASYNFSTFDLKSLRNANYVPMIIDWVIDNVTCGEARLENDTSYACTENSDCYDGENRVGYNCKCGDGFRGNPYLQNGCEDINECSSTSHNCSNICVNTVGSYKCSCPNWYKGDGFVNGTGCTQTLNINKIVASVVTSILVFLLCSGWLFCMIKKRNSYKRREEYFKLNGGIVLRQKLKRKDSDEMVKIYSLEELTKATDNFNDTRIIGKGGFGTVYKGTLSNRVVAIKKSRVLDKIQAEQFVNEFIVLSKIKHINVVSLLGCCLETEVPLLVYDYIANGTLSYHVHSVGSASLPWDIRLRIASETAGALAYLHSSISPPIIHRDVKSSNILLSSDFTTKVSDFGDSRLIPVGQTQLDTLVRGTIGYLDPEYLQTSQLTEKSDVYSFGVVLVELLTGVSAVSSREEDGEMKNLVACFISSMKENRLFPILDAKVVNEGRLVQVQEVAVIADSCLRLRGDDRPTMKEVATELEGLRRVEQHRFVEFELNSEETRRLINETMDFCNTSTSFEFNSLKNQGVSPFEMDGGR